MKSMRNMVGFILAFALAAFAMPGLAQNSKTYVFDKYPQTIKPGENPGQAIWIRNNSPTGNANFNSFRLVAPPGITFKSKPTYDNAVYSANVSDPQGGGKWVDVTNIAPAVAANGVFKLSANLVGDCGAGGKWINTTSSPYTQVWSGSSLSGQEFFNKTNPNAETTVPCNVVFVAPPANAIIVRDETAPVDPYNGYAVVTAAANSYPAGPNPPVKVEVRDHTGAVVSTFSGSISIVIASGPAGAGSGTLATANAEQGTAEFGVGKLLLTKGGNYQLKATTAASSSAPASIFIGDGVLACAQILNGVLVVPDTATFDASLDGAETVEYSGFAAGYRGLNKNGTDCALINYYFTNTIDGTSGVRDANSNLVPANSVSLVWENVDGQQPAFTYTVTFAAEYANNDGYPTKKTKYCVGTNLDCTLSANQKDLKGCLAPDVAWSSIPSGEPACLSIDMSTTVAPSECALLTNPNAPAVPPACIRVTNKFIDAKDPVFIR